MNEKSEVIGERNHTHTLRVGAESLALIKRSGLTYTRRAD